MNFRDRKDAGRRLADLLVQYEGQSPVVLALPRGGVPVAAEVATRLGAPLEVVIVRKVGAPAQPEVAMGAVADATPPVVVANEDVIAASAVSPTQFEAACEQELIEARRRRKRYVGDRRPVDLTGRTALIVDDGVATGATMRVAIGAVRAMRPRRVVVAVPVGAASVIAALRREADDVVCVEEHPDLGAVGFYYDDFRQVSDEEVVEALSRFTRTPPAGSPRVSPSAS